MAGESTCGACGGQLALDCWGCNYHDMAEGIEEAFLAGGAVLGGFIAMAEAIRTRPFDPFASYNAGRDRGPDGE